MNLLLRKVSNHHILKTSLLKVKRFAQFVPLKSPQIMAIFDQSHDQKRSTILHDEVHALISISRKDENILALFQN